MENFQSAMFLANLLYGLEMTPDEFEEVGLLAWAKIGNRQTRLYRYRTSINRRSLSVELPCNAFEIEAVTYSAEDWNYTTNTTVNGDYNSQFTETYIEGRKMHESPLYISGRYAKYERVGDTLIFDKDYGTINILYKGLIVDDEGLPYISEKEKEAIAAYCAYVKKYKEAWVTNNGNILQLAQAHEQKWKQLCSSARVPVYIDQNDMNEILDAKSSWNRKVYNKSYKPIK